VPRELLLAAGVEPRVCAAGADDIAAHPALPRACADLAAQARRHFVASDFVLRRHRGSAGRAPRLMGAVYAALLERLAARGWSRPRTPVRLGRLAKVGILVRHALL